MRHGTLLIAFVLACGLPLGPAPWRPPEAALVQPHPDYTIWWDEVETCVGVSGDFDRIRWFTVEGEAFNTPDHGWAGGRWVPPHDIYLAETHYTSEDVVKHEMVHELLRPGDSEDPRFEECSGIGH
ncbi:MAG: hypothetical protein R3223_00885 [Longimicrobiales bacterium]|nr:hypothetical protein [Longimicrobiales bacterium]